MKIGQNHNFDKNDIILGACGLPSQLPGIRAHS